MLNTLDHPRLCELLAYDPETGKFVWNVTRAPLAQAGNPAGRLSTKGYRHISIDNVRFAAHRLAWFYVFRAWPLGMVDHINGNKDDNRIGNLRDVTNLQNSHNQHGPRTTSQTGMLGVVPVPSKTLPFRAELSREGRKWMLGYFATADEAAAARKGAEAIYNSTKTFDKEPS